MFKKILDFIKGIFGNDFNTNISTNKKIDKTSNKNISKGDHSPIVNIGKLVNNTKADSEEDDEGDDFVFKARWFFYIPTKVSRSGVYLDDDECISPSLSLYCNKPRSGRAGIYLLFKKASKVYNLRIISIHIKVGTFCYDNEEYNKAIFGILNEDYALNISDEKLEEGEGDFTVLLQYEKNDTTYQQLFEFTVFNNARYFVIRRYNKPEEVQSE